METLKVNSINISIWLVLLFSLLITNPALAEIVAEVTQLTGKADVTRNGQAPLALSKGDKIEAQDIVRTKNKTQLQISFTDGSKITLAEKTRLIIKDYLVKNEPMGFFELTRGKIRSFVTKTFSQRKESFQIKTKTAIAGVQGTDFEVHSFPQESLIFVHEGIVSVKNVEANISKKQLLRTGQSAVVRSQTAPELIVMPLSSSTISDEQAEQTLADQNQNENSRLNSGTQQDMRSGGEIKQDPVSLTPSSTRQIPLPPIPNLP